MKKLFLLLLPCVLILSSAHLFSQETAYDLRDLVGARGSSSESAIKDRGYKLIKVDKSSAGIYQYWWNDRKDQCAIVRIADGRVQSAVRAPEPDCGKGKYSNNSSYRNNNGNRGGNRGNRNYANYKDLEGEMATRAYDLLERRGFREGRSHSNDGKTYRVWYNERTDQCIKTLSVNKRIKEVIRSTRCD